MSTLQQNLLIMFGLLPVMLICWWKFIVYLNKEMGFDLHDVYETIYKDPLAASILRVGTMSCVTWLFISAFGRLI